MSNSIELILELNNKLIKDKNEDPNNYFRHQKNYFKMYKKINEVINKNNSIDQISGPSTPSM